MILAVAVLRPYNSARPKWLGTRLRLRHNIHAEAVGGPPRWLAWIRFETWQLAASGKK